MTDAVVGNVLIQGGSPLLGDFDGSGTAGPEDYALWKTTFGQMVTPDTGADGNDDGVISAVDYPVWRDAPKAAMRARRANESVRSICCRDLPPGG